uniref:Uncharacterized protein n=1 Tax=Sphaerodactylus townsendi TaxID=933632 RepID=A0ACB8EF76_9SAUR
MHCGGTMCPPPREGSEGWDPPSPGIFYGADPKQCTCLLCSLGNRVIGGPEAADGLPQKDSGLFVKLHIQGQQETPEKKEQTAPQGRP